MGSCILNSDIISWTIIQHFSAVQLDKNIH